MSAYVVLMLPPPAMVPSSVIVIRKHFVIVLSSAHVRNSSRPFVRAVQPQNVSASVNANRQLYFECTLPLPVSSVKKFCQSSFF